MAKRGLSAFWLLMSIVMLVACGSDSGGGPGPQLGGPSLGGSEGSEASPVPVAVGSPRPGYAGMLPSYYSFNVASAGKHTISLTGVNADVSWLLFGPSGFGDWIDSCHDWDVAHDESRSETLSITGTYYLQVLNWYASSGTPTATYFLTITPPPPSSGCSGSGTCFDFEGGSLPSGFVNVVDNDADWAIDSTNNATGGGTYSLRSGAIGDDQKTCIQYTPAGDTSSVSFNLMTDAEIWDILAFFIDANLQLPDWPGGNSWTRVSFSTTLGPHTYMWCYFKSAFTSVGQDAAWVDDIEVQ